MHLVGLEMVCDVFPAPRLGPKYLGTIWQKNCENSSRPILAQKELSETSHGS